MKNNIIIDAKVYGQTQYIISFKINVRNYTGPVNVSIIEKYTLFNMDFSSTTTAFNKIVQASDDLIDVKLNYLTRINSTQLMFSIIPDPDENDYDISISDIRLVFDPPSGDYGKLVRHKRWEIAGNDKMKNKIDWETILEDEKTFIQSGNMLIEQTGIEFAPRIGILPEYPGIQNVVFFPSSTLKIEYIGQFEGGIVADVAKLHFFKDGIEIKLKRDWLKWYPHKVMIGFSEDSDAARIKIIQTSTITRDDQIVCKLEIDTDDEDIVMNASCDFHGDCAGTIDVFERSGQSYILAENCLKVYLAFSTSSASSSDCFKVAGEPMSYSFSSDCARKVIYLAAAAGMEKDIVESRLFESIDFPERIFEKSHIFWDDYFTTVVPIFKTPDKLFAKLYYMNCYSHMANCYDIDYDPYVYPYVCPNKTLWKPQWAWNMVWGTMSERWLNDIYFSEGGIRNELVTNSMINYGIDLQPLSEYMKGTFFSVNLTGYITNPAATYPMMDLFKRNGDRDFLKAVYRLLADHEYNISFEDHDGDGLPEFWGNIDEYDQSVRWLGLYVDDNKVKKPDSDDPDCEKSDSAKTDGEKSDWAKFLSHDQEKGLFYHTKGILIDYCSHLLMLQNNLATISDFLGLHDAAKLYRAKAAKLKKDINKKMWSEEEGFYFDYSLKRNEKNLRWIITGATPLMGMAASKEQARRVVENLTDTETTVLWKGQEYKAGKFCWNLYPPCTASILNEYWCPDESSGFGMGHIVPTSGARYVIEGLFNYGFYEEARYLINKLTNMLTVVNDTIHMSYTYNSLTGKASGNDLAQQCAVFNDIIVCYIIGIKLRMDDKFEFMPFDVLEDYGPMHFGPFHTKNYPIEIDWDGSSYIAKINGITYDLPYLTKWVIPVDELENRAKNKISFNAISTGDCETSAILEVKAKVHDDEYCFLRVPITGGQEKDYILSANELEGYEGIIDFALYTCHDPKINVSINKIKISSAGKNVEYCERDYLRERLIDIVQPEINGEIIKRIECKLL